jgi:UDP-N-acetylglucosamine 2-epimerase (non-hydrolysing)
LARRGDGGRPVIRVVFLFGTRPEAIKMCPVVLHLRERSDEFEPRVCVTGQHRSMLDQVLDAFGVAPDHDMNLMTPAQTLAQSTSRILAATEAVLLEEHPDMVLVQGDTTTTLAGALGAFYQGIPVGHVEAGLRTWDLAQPFPEEMNRVVTTRVSTLHFAPTAAAARNLLSEGVPSERIAITGNPGIDSVLWIRDALRDGRVKAADWSFLDPGKRLIVVTAHRRESFGEGLESICTGLARLARRGDVEIVYAVHRNPNVDLPARRILAAEPNVRLTEPLDYVNFVALLQRSYLVITDSGGIQEEGPSLGKPILVARDKTERPEGVDAGTVRLVGTDAETIYREASRLLEAPAERDRMTRLHNPYGDGHASRRIAQAIRRFFTRNRG